MQSAATQINRNKIEGSREEKTPLCERNTCVTSLEKKPSRSATVRRVKEANRNKHNAATSDAAPVSNTGSTHYYLLRKFSLLERLFVLDPDKNKPPPTLFNTIIRPCIAECYGLMIFVFIGTMTIAAKKGELAVALTHGLTIFALVASFGHISGGHFNPAVTIGLALSGGIKPVMAFLYVISQLLGSVLGSSFALLAVPYESLLKVHGGANLLVQTDGVTFTMGMICECFTTMALVTTVLNMALDSHGKNILAPLAIGITVSVDFLAVSHISGASMNPARSFGPAVLSNEWRDHILNWIGPLSGTMVAAFLYRFVFASRDRNITELCYADEEFQRL